MTLLQSAILFLASAATGIILLVGFSWGRYYSKSDQWTSWPAAPAGVAITILTVTLAITAVGRMIVIAFTQ